MKPGKAFNPDGALSVVPYIGTWIETETWSRTANLDAVVPYIGTWIETITQMILINYLSRTLYRYVD